MSYQEIFGKIKAELAKADTSSLDENFALQVYIEGEGEGIFYIEFKDNIFKVEPFDYDGYCAFLRADKETFIKIFSGELDIVKAISDDKLIVEGDVKAATMIQKIDFKKE